MGKMLKSSQYKKENFHLQFYMVFRLLLEFQLLPLMSSSWSCLTSISLFSNVAFYPDYDMILDC